MKKLFIFIAILFLSFESFAQLSITFPTARAVFQRDKNNGADISISGTFSTKQVDRIEARLTPLVTGQGTATSFQVIQNNPQGGSFSGKIHGTGGWYRLEVRTVVGSNVIETTGIDRVGVGEVFIIVGQSNAQGKYINQGEKGANDDRVNCVNTFSTDPLYQYQYQYAPRTTLSFSHADQSVFIAPSGYGVWCWGELGDMLVNRLNVPVMFFNAAWGGSSSNNWLESAQGKPTLNYAVNDGKTTLPYGFPYQNLKNTLNFYASILGVRAILWHQGETDTDPLFTNAQTYAANLQGLINISRTDANKNISWVISRASLTYPNSTSSQVIAGQNAVLAIPNFNTFAGPSTDGLQLPRPDGVHFLNVSGGVQGLNILANAWNQQLDANFFSNSTPFTGSSLVPIQPSCDGNNNAVMALQSGYSSYQWTNGNGNNSISVNGNDASTYSAILKDGTGNYLLSTSAIAGNFYGASPTVTAKSATLFCVDKSVDLVVSSNLSNIRWNTGETATTITIKTGGNFYTTGNNSLGCISQSNVITTQVDPVPAQPSITSNTPLLTCEGSSVVLNSNSNLKAFWTTNDSTQSIAITKVGDYTVAVQVRDNVGCFSPISNSVKVSIHPTPAKPIITAANGLFNACDGSAVILTASGTLRPLWSTNDTTRNITFTKLGDYNVNLRVRDNIGCTSPFSNAVKVSILPTPAPPTISASGPLAACEGTNVVLTASGSLKAFWNTVTNDSTRTITLTKAGDYNVAVRVRNDVGCYSVYSPTTKVSIRPRPIIPTIVQVGTYTLEATQKDGQTGDAFEWQKDNAILPNKATKDIKITQQGYYAVTISRIYSLDNNLSLTCRSPISSLVSYVPDQFIDNLSIYPNPNTTGIFTIETKDDFTNVQLLIYTLKGQIITTASIPIINARETLDLSTLENGQYIVKLVSGSFKSSKRVYIEKSAK